MVGSANGSQPASSDDKKLFDGASGTDADQLFVSLALKAGLGLLRLAEKELAEGGDKEMRDLANEIRVTMPKEVKRFEALSERFKGLTPPTLPTTVPVVSLPDHVKAGDPLMKIVGAGNDVTFVADGGPCTRARQGQSYIATAIRGDNVVRILIGNSTSTTDDLPDGTYTQDSAGYDAQVQVHLSNGTFYNSSDLTSEDDRGEWSITLKDGNNGGHVKAISYRFDDSGNKVSSLTVEGDWSCYSLS